MTPSLSIIIPTLNEEEVIEKTLAKLLQNRNCEIIVVDGGQQRCHPGPGREGWL